MSRFRLVCSLLIGLLTLSASELHAADPPVLQVQQDASLVTVAVGPQLVLKYRYGDAPFKPYIQELCTPSGVQILRDSPADHVHHRGVMYGIFANGIDFWSETPQCGKQVSRGLAAVLTDPKDGVASCRLAQGLDWIPPNADRPLLIERRLLQVHRGADLQATLLTWHLDLQPAEGVNAVKLTGSHYDGLGIRFVQSMDQVGQFQYAAGVPGPIVRDTERVTLDKWAAYTAPADGKTVTVAIFDDPHNVRHPAGMFTMLQPFSYLSATPNIWKEPLELAQGKSLAARYGIAVWDGKVGQEQIESLYQRWLKL
jgi:Methane oxygenase PmoA